MVNVALPVRDNERTIDLAIRSILQQTYQNWELLVIDDGSIDRTVDVARAFNDPRIKVIVGGAAVGLPARLNQAIDLARCEYFARMDGDDVAYPQRLELQVAYLQQHPEVDLVGASAIVFRSTGEIIGKRAVPTAHDDICANPVGGFPLIHPTYVGRIEFFRKYRYREDAIRCEDRDLLLRSYRFSRYANVPQILLGYREDRLHYKKQLLGRFYGARIMWSEFLRLGRPDFAGKAVMQQSVKCVVDCLAIATGLQHTLLPHRARPVSEQDRKEWYSVWSHLTKTPATDHPYHECNDPGFGTRSR